MDGFRLPSPIPPAHLRNARPFHVDSVRRPSPAPKRHVGQIQSQDVPRRNGSRAPPFVPMHYSSSNPGHTNRSPYRPNGRQGPSPSRNREVGESRSPSPVAVSREGLPRPVRQLTFREPDHVQPAAPVVIIPTSCSNATRNHVHRSERLSRSVEAQPAQERSHSRSWSTDPEHDRFTERPNSRQDFVRRFTTQIPSRSRSRLGCSPAVGAPETNAGHPRTEHRSKCNDADELDQSISRRTSKVQEITKPEGVELVGKQEGENFECNRLIAGAAVEQVRSGGSQDTRIKALEDELAVARKELERERQHRVRLEAETKRHEGQVMQKPDSGHTVQGQPVCDTNAAHDPHEICDGKWELVDVRGEDKRKETEDKWTELRSVVKKIQEDVAGIRNTAEQAGIDKNEKPGFKEAIEELHKENAEQRKFLSSLADRAH